mmetsp:Transcript_11685/g.23780  ORF Transcript_11685/g.23780 Transcript_11685/m.23780 type:complete len:98 (-) Transcript_11685:296-589(-)
MKNSKYSKSRFIRDGHWSVQISPFITLSGAGRKPFSRDDSFDQQVNCSSMEYYAPFLRFSSNTVVIPHHFHMALHTLLILLLFRHPLSPMEMSPHHF